MQPPKTDCLIISVKNEFSKIKKYFFTKTCNESKFLKIDLGIKMLREAVVALPVYGAILKITTKVK